MDKRKDRGRRRERSGKGCNQSRTQSDELSFGLTTGHRAFLPSLSDPSFSRLTFAHLHFNNSRHPPFLSLAPIELDRYGSESQYVQYTPTLASRPRGKRELQEQAPSQQPFRTLPTVDIKTAVRQINAVSGDDAWASTVVSSNGRMDMDGPSKIG